MSMFRVQLGFHLFSGPFVTEVVEASGYPDAVIQVLRGLSASTVHLVHVCKQDDEQLCIEYLDFAVDADGQFTAEAAYSFPL